MVVVTFVSPTEVVVGAGIVVVMLAGHMRSTALRDSLGTPTVLLPLRRSATVCASVSADKNWPCSMSNFMGDSRERLRGI